MHKVVDRHRQHPVKKLKLSQLLMTLTKTHRVKRRRKAKEKILLKTTSRNSGQVVMILCNCL